MVDACRGYYSEVRSALKGFSESYDSLSGDIETTRQFFEAEVMSSDQGWTILYSASENETSLDTSKGGAYILSFLEALNDWNYSDNESNSLNLKEAQERARILIRSYPTTQIPTMNSERRIVHFPIAVKATLLNRFL